MIQLRLTLFAGLLSAAAIAVATGIASASPADAAVNPKPTLTQPALSPDGRTLAFVSGGNIWAVPATGGAAHLLVSDAGNASRPLYSPDGKRLAFVSDKSGGGDLYILDFKSGRLRRLTWADGREQLSAWSRDGEWLYFSTARDNIGSMRAIYRIRASGGTPMPVASEPYRNEEAGAPSPQGDQVALVGGGWGSAQWWRDGHAHIDDTAIWLLNNDGSHRYRRATPDDARHLWPMWSANGRLVYYMSDRSGAENIWRVPADGGDPARVTKFSDGRVLWPTIAANGGTIAFQRDFRIWTLDTGSGATRPVPIKLHGVVAGDNVTHQRFNRDFRELALSPDGDKLAFIAHGEIFAAPARKSGARPPARRVTHTPAAEFDLAWGSDSRRIVYSSERDAHDHVYEYDFVTETETELTRGAHNDTHPRLSPKGDALVFLRDGKALYRLDLASRNLTRLARAPIDLHRPLQSERPFVWSPDGQWIAFLAWGPRMYRNARIVPATGGQTRPVSFLGNTFGDTIAWSGDGQTLYFSTGQRSAKGHAARVNLVPRTPTFHDRHFEDLFEAADPSPAADQKTRTQPDEQTQPTEQQHEADSQDAPLPIAFDDIGNRLRLLPVGLDVSSIAVAPDGDKMALVASINGKQNLYVYSLDAPPGSQPVPRQLTATGGSKRSVQFSPGGGTLYYLDGGRAFSVGTGGGTPRRLQLNAEMDVHFAAVKQAAFAEVWDWLKNNFHESDMNSVDWGATRARYAPYIAGARTPRELHRLLNRMAGELNASHSGLKYTQSPPPVTGRLGLGFDPRAYERDGEFRIKQVVPLSPAAVTGDIKPGDYLLAIDGHELGADTNLARLLNYTIGRATTLRVASQAAGDDAKTVRVRPITTNWREHLAYRAWVDQNRAYVSRISDDRLGYIHLPDMSMTSLRRFYRAINSQNATKAGVVIDIRNNYGGFVNAYALDVLARKPYLKMRFRGMAPVGARPVLGQSALNRPTVLVTNRVTLSDGEDFAQGYRALSLGKTVGEPTAGWIIYSADARLIDGSTLRLPFITVTDAAGQSLEAHPRPVDVGVERPLGEAYRNKDSYLDTAVRVLMDQIAPTPTRMARRVKGTSGVKSTR